MSRIRGQRSDMVGVRGQTESRSEVRHEQGQVRQGQRSDISRVRGQIESRSEVRQGRGQRSAMSRVEVREGQRSDRSSAVSTTVHSP